MRGVISTRQVTKALQMVSAMKMRKAQEESAKSRAYRRRLEDMLRTFDLPISAALPDLAGSSGGTRILVVTFGSDRGLCGPFNNNLINAVARMFREQGMENVDIKSVGWKVGAVLNRRGYPVISNTRRPAVPDRVAFQRTLAAELRERWNTGQYKSIVLLYASLRGMSVQRPEMHTWLPLEGEDENTPTTTVDFIDEPSTVEVFAETVLRQLDNALLGAIVDSEASEHVARMVAMDNATRNAQDLYDGLKLTFNKARQAKITQEICEIVSGANAIGA